MKTVVLFGAGQIGAMVSRLMGPEYRVACFADNNRRKWGGTLAGIQIVSPAESLLFFPDCFCLPAASPLCSGPAGTFPWS